MASSTRNRRALPAGGVTNATPSGNVNLAGATGPTPAAQANYNAQLQALRAPTTTAGAEGPGVPGVAIGGPALPPPMIMPTPPPAASPQRDALAQLFNPFSRTMSGTGNGGRY